MLSHPIVLLPDQDSATIAHGYSDSHLGAVNNQHQANRVFRLLAPSNRLKVRSTSWLQTPNLGPPRLGTASGNPSQADAAAGPVISTRCAT